MFRSIWDVIYNLNGFGLFFNYRFVISKNTHKAAFERRPVVSSTVKLCESWQRHTQLFVVCSAHAHTVFAWGQLMLFGAMLSVRGAECLRGVPPLFGSTRETRKSLNKQNSKISDIFRSDGKSDASQVHFVIDYREISLKNSVWQM